MKPIGAPESHFPSGASPAEAWKLGTARTRIPLGFVCAFQVKTRNCFGSTPWQARKYLTSGPHATGHRNRFATSAASPRWSPPDA